MTTQVNKTKEIWFIHGANATSTSFNYIRNSLKNDPNFQDCRLVDVTYDCQINLVDTVKVLAQSAPSDKPLYMIGHSLGGVVATAVAQRIEHFDLPCTVKGVISLASPFGGSESANYLQFLYPKFHLFRNINTKNRLIRDLQATGAVVPTLSLVTTSGNNPLLAVANDGVVTVNSQRSLPKAEYIEVPYNHFEVLVSDETVEHIKLFLQRK